MSSASDSGRCAAPSSHVAVADERSHAVGAFGLEHADLDSRVAFSEPADQRRHRVDGKRRQRGDLERPVLQLEHSGDRVACLLDRAEDLAGGTDQRLAGGGQAQPASDAMKQLHAELGLQGRRRLRERRLSHVQALGGTRDAALFDHGEEVVEATLIHR